MKTIVTIYTLCIYILLLLASGFSFGISLHRNNKYETGQRPLDKGSRFRPSNTAVNVEIYAIFYLVLLMICVLIVIVYRPNINLTASFMLRLILPIVLAIIYFCILLPFTPLIRKNFTARTSASMWEIPFFMLYLSVMFRPKAYIFSPFWVVTHVSDHYIGTALEWIAAVWIIGFVVVLSWHIISHFMFRHRLLHVAYPVTDGKTLDIWSQEERYANYKKLKHLPLICPLIHTPLTIGLFNSTIRVLLPEKNYTPEEMSLIFRHELVHICRNDDGNKFSMILLCSLFWFNPLMWIARKKASEDMELSCDETVLLNADEQKRMDYANLLLHTAGDSRGFTTCLSASLESMRYRLNSIMRPKRRQIGGALVATVAIILFLTAYFVTPNIAFTHNSTTLGSAIHAMPTDSVYIETIKKNQKIELLDYTIDAVEFEINNQAELCKQIMELNVAELLSMRNPPLEFEEHYTIHLRVNGDLSIISINENYVKIKMPDGDRYVTRYYKLKDTLSIEQSLIPAS